MSGSSKLPAPLAWYSSGCPRVCACKPAARHSTGFHCVPAKTGHASVPTVGCGREGSRWSPDQPVLLLRFRASHRSPSDSSAAAAQISAAPTSDSTPGSCGTAGITAGSAQPAASLAASSLHVCSLPLAAASLLPSMSAPLCSSAGMEQPVLTWPGALAHLMEDQVAQGQAPHHGEVRKGCAKRGTHALQAQRDGELRQVRTRSCEARGVRSLEDAGLCGSWPSNAEVCT